MIYHMVLDSFSEVSDNIMYDKYLHVVIIFNLSTKSGYERLYEHNSFKGQELFVFPVMTAS